MFRKYVLPLLSVVLLIFAVTYVVRGQQGKPAKPPEMTPAPSPYAHTVAGAGILEAQTENISVGSPLPGVVLEVYVPVEKVGQRVQKGDPLFRVDDRALRAQLKVQEAAADAADAQVKKLEQQPRPEEVPQAEAKVAVAEANVRVQEDLASRAQRLQNNGAMSQEDISQRVLALKVARQQLAQAKADLALTKAGAWERDLAISRAQLEQARAVADQTRTDIDRCLVRAPVDGEVLQVNVRPGEFVGAPPNQALVVLGNVHQLHVRVDIDEHDIPRFRPGAPAVASLRGDPRQQFPLTFVRVEPYVIPKKSLTGDNTERVDTRVLQVIYAVDATDRPLYVGQQVDVSIQSDAGPSTGP